MVDYQSPLFGHAREDRAALRELYDFTRFAWFSGLGIYYLVVRSAGLAHLENARCERYFAAFVFDYYGWFSAVADLRYFAWRFAADRCECSDGGFNRSDYGDENYV